MSNNNNLIIPSSEEARINGRKGGLKSVESRRKRKSMKEQLEMILALPLTLKDTQGKALIDKYRELGIKNTDINNQMAISIELFLTAIGNSKSKIQAIKAIREIVQDEDLSKEDTEITIRVIRNLEEGGKKDENKK